MKTEYPELNDKEVKIQRKDKIDTAYVNGCDYHVGISLSLTQGGTDYTICLWGPGTGKWKKNRKGYRKLFNIFVKALKSGIVVQEEIRKAYMSIGPDYSPGIVSAETCPFNQ